jgi:hypothetical protein
MRWSKAGQAATNRKKGSNSSRGRALDDGRVINPASMINWLLIGHKHIYSGNRGLGPPATEWQ